MAAATKRSTIKLGAMPFDMAWARSEVKYCRIRFRKRGIYELDIDDDEIVSLLCHLWVCVVAGEVGSFRPDQAKPIIPQLQAYTAACIDNEVMRHLRQEGSRHMMTVKRGEEGPRRVLLEPELIDLTDYDQSADLAHLVSHGDPLNIILAIEGQEDLRDEQGICHPMQIGDILSEWIDKAYAMDLRQAQAIRSRRRPTPGVPPSQTRVNLAWAVTMTAASHDEAQTRKLAPMLCARWLDQSSQATKKLIKKIYPSLEHDSPTNAVAERESRNVLRLLSVRAEVGPSVGPEHRRIVVEDAQDAMNNWVGTRAPYKLKRHAQTEQPIDTQPTEDRPMRATA